MKKKAAASGKAEKKEPIRICYECGKEILPGDPAEHVVTRRRTELWFHRRRVGGRK